MPIIILIIMVVIYNVIIYSTAWALLAGAVFLGVIGSIFGMICGIFRR